MSYINCPHYNDGYCLKGDTKATGVPYDCARNNACPDALNATMNMQKESTQRLKQIQKKGDKPLYQWEAFYRLSKKVVAVHPNGDVEHFGSIAEAAAAADVHGSTVYTSCHSDLLRPYKSRDRKNWRTRFAFEADPRWKELAERNKSTLQ